MDPTPTDFSWGMDYAWSLLWSAQSDPGIKYSNSTQKCTFGAVSHLEFYSHSSVILIIYKQKSFLVLGTTGLRAIERNWVKFHNEKHDFLMKRKIPDY